MIKLKNKILIISLFFAILFLLYTCKSYAYTGTAVTSESTGISDTLLDLFTNYNNSVPVRKEYPYYYIETDNYYLLSAPYYINYFNTYSDYIDNGYSHFCFCTDLTCTSTSSGDYYYYSIDFVVLDNDSNLIMSIPCLSYLICDKNYNIIAYYSEANSFTTYTEAVVDLSTFDNIISEVSTATVISNISTDITYGTEGDSVFQSTSTQTTTLWTVETIQEVPKMMTEALTVIIPVGLIICGIGLLIYLVRYWISLAR